MSNKTLLIIPILLFCNVISGQFKNIEGKLTETNLPAKLTLQNGPDKSTAVAFPSIRYDSFSNDFQTFLKRPNLISKSTDGKSFLIEGEFSGNYKFTSFENKIEAYLTQVKQILSLESKDYSFVLLKEVSDDLNMNHRYMQLSYKGFPIYGSEIIIHSHNQKINSVNGRVEKVTNPINTSARFSSEEILDQLSVKALEEKAIKDLNFEERYKPQSELVIFVDDNGETKLCYHVIAYRDLIDRREYFVDANEGNIIKEYSSICKFHNHDVGINGQCSHHSHHDLMEESSSLMDGPKTAVAQDLLGVSRTINTYQVGSNYFLIDASRSMFNAAQSNMPNEPNGVIWTVDLFNQFPSGNFSYGHVSSSDNTWSNQRTGVSAHHNAAEAYKYFKNTHNRESISGNGQNIVSFINVSESNGQPMDNAFWNGAAMFYGNGSQAFRPLARGLDVAGHEMTHGVVQNTANLQYYGESGALNESFADVFGVMIDKGDWLIGEDVVNTNVFPSGALRSMADPHNGGNQLGDNGYQPKHYSERYTGSQDNGGVHINSGIPNHAFYLFANNSNVGTERAERVYYRALTNYLTMSSQFVDCRIAVIKAAQDLYDDSVVNAARSAFDQVGIIGDEGGDYQNDLEINEGDDFILFTQENNAGLYVFTPAGEEVFNPLSTNSPISKPSITDDGSEIVYVASDKQIHYITLDVETQQSDEIIFDFGVPANWRNAVFSKDGLRMAFLPEELNNEIHMYDFVEDEYVIYELFNPTFSEGVSTGDVLFADALEFDLSGEYLVYDAKNEIQGNNGSIEYWDIGFIKVWNNETNNFASTNQINKLFGSLPDGVSVGNPTFAKNSPYILAFEVLSDEAYDIYGMNIETGDQRVIFQNNGLNYPNYSKTDEYMLFDFPLQSNIDIGVLQLESDKITTVANTESFLFPFEGTRWGVWFSNGERILSDVDDERLYDNTIILTPNPVSDRVNVSIPDAINGQALVKIISVSGLEYYSKSFTFGQSFRANLNVGDLPNGSYFISIITEDKNYKKKFIKI